MRRWFMFPSLAVLLVSGAAAQNTGRITGTVTSETGQVVVGADVVVVGTGVRTVTGVDGKYALTGVPVGPRQVRVTIIGYVDLVRPVSVPADGVATLDFGLTTQAVQLQEIVAVGYGEQQRSTLTGAVGSVRAEQIRQIATSDPIKAIQGRIPGVEVVSANNLPGSAMNIRIRGIRSITASNEPLYVVDGVPLAGGIGDFNPASIKSIEILKDAAATAIYGSRASNGVVLVTTKTGAPDVANGVQLQFTADMYSGWQRPLQLIEMMNMDQYVAMLQAAARYAGVSDQVTSVLNNDVLRNAFAAGNQTDWQREILRTGEQRDFQIGMGGITGNTRFSLNAGYFDHLGLAEGQDHNRASAVASLDHTVGRLRLGFTANGSRSLQNLGSGNGLWGYALAQTGFGAPYDADGLLLPHPDGDNIAVNPVRAQQFFFNEVTRNRLFASMYSDVRLADGLNWRVNFGPDLVHQQSGTFQGPQTTYPEAFDARAELNTSNTFAYTIDNLLQFNRTFGAAHRLDATLLYGVQHSKTTNEFGSAQQLPYNEQLWYNLGSGSDYLVRSELSEWALRSYMGRVNYTLLDRYTVSGTLRRDGSSRLADDNKWTNFPSVGVAWQLGNESFMSGLPFLSALKLRASYGVTGNTSVAPYQTQGALGRTVYNFGNVNGFGYGPNDSNPANPDLSWEKTYKRDVGLEFGLFNDRIVGVIDWYREDTKDLIMRRTLPKTSGFSSALLNIGETLNRGLEIALSTVNVENWNGLRWTTDISWAHNHNEIVSLATTTDPSECPANARPCDPLNGWFVGHPINIGGTNPDNQRRVWYDYRMVGIWQLGQEAEAAGFGSQFKPGEIRLADVNGDGRITAADRVILGNTFPKWTASMYNRVSWKALDVSALVTARWNYMIFDAFGDGTNSMQGRLGNIVTDYWTPENASNTQPAPRINGNVVPYSSTRGYVDGSHWRVRNVTLGLTLGQNVVQRIGATNMRIYFTAQDPFFVSDYKGYDPENGTAAGHPAYRTLLIGANVGW